MARIIDPEKTKGIIAPSNIPANICGSVKEISSSAISVSNLALNRNPPKDAKATKVAI